MSSSIGLLVLLSRVTFSKLEVFEAPQSASDHAGRGLDAAEQVGEELRLGVRLLGVAAAGVPGPAAVVVLAPGGGVVGAHRAGARAVARLVQAGQHVHVWRAGWCWKLYHSSKRDQRSGRSAVDGCAWSSTLTVACWFAGWLAKYAPTRSPYQAQSYSVSEAAWTPT